MKIGFLLKRVTYLKTMGSLIQASLARRHEVVLFYIPGASKGTKAYQNASHEKLEPLERLGADLVEIEIEGISTLGRRFGIDVLVTQEGFYNFRAQLDALQALRKSNVRLVSLSHFFEIAQQPLDALEYFDKTFYISDYARDLHFALQRYEKGDFADDERRAGRWAVSGSPMFDQIGTMDRQEARAALNLPQDRKIVLLIDPVIASTTPWRFHVWRDADRLTRTRGALDAGRMDLLGEIWFGSTFRETFKEIKNFCVRQEALLLIKSRGKQPVSRFLSEAADMYANGMNDEYFPVFTTYKFLAASDLCITANSMAAAEAVAAGIPCVNIYLPHMDLAAPTTDRSAKYFEQLLGGKPDSLLNFRGCVWKVDRREASAWFKKHDVRDVVIDPESRELYKQKFLDIEQTSASRRILTDLES